jgi:replication factor C subunit 3/5
VAQDAIVGTIRKLVDSNRLPHLLFYGPPGTGKTSTILCVAREMYGSKVKNMVLELNASDARGIDVVRNEIQNFAGTRKLFSTGTKLIILDECDNMTKDAQMALRRVIEKYSSNARFCLICNYASKIIPALQSRCTRFRFAPLKQHLVENRVKEIAHCEGVELSEGGLQAALKLGQGDMRKILNILQSTALSHGNKVCEASVYRCTGMPTSEDIQKCQNALLNESVTKAFETIRSVQRENGLALLDVLTALSELLRAVKLPATVRIPLMKNMAEIEYALCAGASEALQLGSLVGSFYKVRAMLSAEPSDESMDVDMA